jgi:hypothetical protein
VVHVDLAVISFDIDFGTPKPKLPELVTSWQQFCHDFLNLSGSDTTAVNNPVAAFPIVQASLAAGRNNLSNLPNSRRDKPLDKRDDDLWIVRGDELELAAATVVPVANVNIGKATNANTGLLQGNNTPDGVQDRSHTGKPVMVARPLTLESKGLLRSNKPAPKLSVHPMGKTLGSVLNVTVIKDELSVARPLEMTGWTMKEEVSALPAALWDPAKPNLRPSEPSAKVIPECITGIKSLKPPSGKLGKQVVPPPLDWHKLDVFRVERSTTAQEIPAASRTRNLQTTMAEKQDDQKKVVAALAAAGFTLTSQAPAPADVRFRELLADPLAGAVAA